MLRPRLDAEHTEEDDDDDDDEEGEEGEEEVYDDGNIDDKW